MTEVRGRGVGVGEGEGRGGKRREGRKGRGALAGKGRGMRGGWCSFASANIHVATPEMSKPPLRSAPLLML